MGNLSAIRDELSCIKDSLILLSSAVTDDYAEGVGKPNPQVLQNAIYSEAAHIGRILSDLDTNF